MSQGKFVVLLFLFFFMASGCIAPLPPAQPASDLSAIAGKWEGTFYSLNNRLLSSTLTINADGTYEDLIPGLPTPVFVGQVTVADGQYRAQSETSGRMYTIVLYEGEGKRVLVKTPDDKTYSTTQYRPAK